VITTDISKRCLFVLFLALVLAASAAAEVTLPAILGDNMVLQQGKSARLWGWAAPGEMVAAGGSWSQRLVITEADDEGRWSLRLSLPEPGGPYAIKIQGKNALLLQNVLVGEVWVCSGQSNMEMGIASCNDAAQEIAAADHPGIRLFKIPRAIAALPRERLDPDGHWDVCTPESAGDGGWSSFSGAAYYFGRRLHEELGVPVGLIQSAWGGTPAESWTTRSMLEKIGGYESNLGELDLLAHHPDEVAARNERKLADWERACAEADPGLGEPSWSSPGFDDAAWPSMEQPSNWQGTDLQSFDGIVWMRKEIVLPAHWSGRELELELGPIDDEDHTWVNGTLVGQTKGWTTKRHYSVPGIVSAAGRCVVTVRVFDTGGGGGFHGAHQDLRIYPSGAPHEAFSLAGAWRYRASAQVRELPRRPNLLQVSAYATATGLYNAMIHPIVSFSIRGAIWYQGEANASRARRYDGLLRAMIDSWRESFDAGGFPFYYVQIAPFLYWAGSDGVGVREAQRRAMSHPNTGMVVTSDIGNIHDIHPRNKQDVGERLAIWALGRTYGKPTGVVSGPTFKAMKVEGNRARLYFDYCGSGLAVRPGQALTSFKLAAADGIFLPAEAQIDGDTVVLTCPQIEKPAGALYAYSNTAEGNLINEEGLPASCFNTLWNRDGENRNTALVSTPRAGWWWNRHVEKLERVRKGDVDLLFIGDSITQSWEGSAGSELFEKYYGHRKAVNLGFSGDRTENVLWRLDNGEIDGISPKVAVVKIGTNNTAGPQVPGTLSAEQIAEGIIAICKTLRIKLPSTKILILCPLPRGEKPSARRTTALDAGKIASRIADGRTIFYLDMSDAFVKADGTIDKAIMPDFLHLSREGYAIWARVMEPTLSALFEDRAVK